MKKIPEGKKVLKDSKVTEVTEKGVDPSLPPYPGSPRVVVYAGFEEVVAPVGNIWVLLLPGEVGTIDS